MIPRQGELSALKRLLRRYPVVAITGSRQVGKTTLARMLADEIDKQVHFFDLEQPEDLARLSEPMLVLRPLKGLAIVDEVQRRPDLFTILRVLADRQRRPARFLLLGSASPQLLNPDISWSGMNRARNSRRGDLM